jgi:hypothetical protein
MPILVNYKLGPVRLRNSEIAESGIPTQVFESRHGLTLLIRCVYQCSRNGTVFALSSSASSKSYMCLERAFMEMLIQDIRYGLRILA